MYTKQPTSGDYHRLLSSKKWTNTRLRYIATHPFCEICEENSQRTGKGFVLRAKVVHHKEPLQNFPNYWAMRRAAYDPANLMALCEQHHEQIHQIITETKQQTAFRNTEAVRSFEQNFFGEILTEARQAPSKKNEKKAEQLLKVQEIFDGLDLDALAAAPALNLEGPEE